MMEKGERRRERWGRGIGTKKGKRNVPKGAWNPTSQQEEDYDYCSKKIRKAESIMQRRNDYKERKNEGEVTQSGKKKIYKKGKGQRTRFSEKNLIKGVVSLPRKKGVMPLGKGKSKRSQLKKKTEGSDSKISTNQAFPEGGKWPRKERGREKRTIWKRKGTGGERDDHFM